MENDRIKRLREEYLRKEVARMDAIETLENEHAMSGREAEALVDSWDETNGKD